MIPPLNEKFEEIWTLVDTVDEVAVDCISLITFKRDILKCFGFPKGYTTITPGCHNDQINW